MSQIIGFDRELRKVLIVLDEALAEAQPTLAQQIQAYFNTHSNVGVNMEMILIITGYLEGGQITRY